MKTNFSLKFNIKDLLTIIIASVLIIAGIIGTNFIYNKDISQAQVCVYYQGEKIEKYSVNLSSLTNQQTIVLTKSEYKDLLGDFTILVDPEKGIKVENVICPNHYCEKQGWVARVNYPITCLPNDVIVILENAYEDTPIYIG